MPDAPPTDEPDRIEPTIRVETWRDAAGVLWGAVTGRTAMWALGPAVRVTVYPRAMRLCIGLGLALLTWIAYQVGILVELVRLVAAKEAS